MPAFNYHRKILSLFVNAGVKPAPTKILLPANTPARRSENECKNLCGPALIENQIQAALQTGFHRSPDLSAHLSRRGKTVRRFFQKYPALFSPAPGSPAGHRLRADSTPRPARSSPPPSAEAHRNRSPCP